MRAWRPNTESSRVLLASQRVLNEYPYPVTFKQLYYRLVATGVIENSMSKYRMLNNLITNARKYGRLHPSLFVPTTPVSLASIPVSGYLQTCIDHYHLDRTSTQKNYVEVWVEKNTVHSFVDHLLRPYDVPVFVTQGHSNYAFAYQAYKRLRAATQAGKVPRVICLTDLCVSSHNNFEYFLTEMASLFEISYAEVVNVIFSLGILPDHIVRYDLIEAPSRTNDRRTASFDEKYGDILESLDLPRNTRVELEAIDPKMLRTLIYNTVFGILDYDSMLEVERREQKDKETLNKMLMGLES
jgi:hypothetical protein